MQKYATSGCSGSVPLTARGQITAIKHVWILRFKHERRFGLIIAVVAAIHT